MLSEGTWVIPNGNCCIQIDHILIDKRHARTVEDIKSRRGAVAETDHFMMWNS